MSHRNVQIGTTQGLHARPAGLVVRAVVESGVRVALGRVGSAPVDAASLLAILTLNLKHGEPVVLTAEGAGSEAVLDELALLLASELDAPAT